MLVDIVGDYPSYVYLAPYPGMDAKIALAAPGRLETLDNLDIKEYDKLIKVMDDFGLTEADTKKSDG